MRNVVVVVDLLLFIIKKNWKNILFREAGRMPGDAVHKIYPLANTKVVDIYIFIDIDTGHWTERRKVKN